jgi:mono/diheme cytochrome c family protein
MKKPTSSTLIRVIQISIAGILAVVVYLGLTQQSGTQVVHALPEYSTRTSEPCATCHVNPGGGGPRTLRGLLWAAQGRPNEVPQIPGLLIAPGATDGMELYDIACAGCHGFQGEGLFAIGLEDTGIPKPAIRTFIQQGLVPLGMPSFEGQFTEEQLETLVDFVARLANNEVELNLYYPLPPAELNCNFISETTRCGGQGSDD